jgi:thiol-disulfide isomerase/thioredoxin
MRVSTITAIALTIMLTATLPPVDAHAAPSIDAAAPPLILTELSGATFDLHGLHGKVVLVHYWATWCAPCRKELPLLNSFYKRHHDDGLEVVGISADHPRDFAKMRKVSATLAYPTATLDHVSDDGFGPPQGFPLTYVVDRQGVVRAQFVDVDEQLLRDVVLPLLGK